MRVLILFSVVLILGCEPMTEFCIKEVKLITQNQKRLSNWYTDHLGFESVHGYDTLQYGDFRLVIEENDKAIHRDSVKVLHDIPHVRGFYRLAFLTNQLDGLTKTLLDNEVRFVGGMVKDTILNRRTVVVRDPDGNRIQFFEDNGRHKLKPYLVSLISEAVGEQEKWYQVKLPVSSTHKLDIPGQDIYIRLLEGEHIAIELIEGKLETRQPEIDYDRVVGIRSVEVVNAKSLFEEDHEGNSFIGSE